ncbi:LysR family transcriptional regulator [Dyella silvatica]|uniref:LysR family transcriptional regulator n=1 Tax=Dyella silvatica TaxID=2992128 RepID=UPI00225041F8|nr:LysR family transcriptional regulator [Dyella silvatica]
MKPSPDTLRAFTEAAHGGSFTAAARVLGKSQSTISEAIANLEIDLGVKLFDRSTRRPQLTPEGQLLLAQASLMLQAEERFMRTAGQLAAGLEPRLTVVLTDRYQSPDYESILAELDQRYPALEFECLLGEGADALALVQEGRAQLAMVAAQPAYPSDLARATAQHPSQTALFVAATHPLAKQPSPSVDDLAHVRELRLNTYLDEASITAKGHYWSAPSFLLLMEMAELGFGWAALPRWMVERYAPGKLVELRLPGWPQQGAIDVVWSSRRPLGVAGHWLRQRLSA